MSRIVSSSSGRIRIRDKNLRNQLKLNALKKELLNLATITELQENIRTGSLLVRFDPNAIDIGVLKANIDSSVDNLLGQPSVSQSLLSKKNINRYNKIVMLASLGASVAFAIMRPKYWKCRHSLTSYVFLANLGIHLTIYRKPLLRLFR
jgi:hypothetical protein